MCVCVCEMHLRAGNHSQRITQMSCICVCVCFRLTAEQLKIHGGIGLVFLGGCVKRKCRERREEKNDGEMCVCARAISCSGDRGGCDESRQTRRTRPCSCQSSSEDHRLTTSRCRRGRCTGREGRQ